MAARGLVAVQHPGRMAALGHVAAWPQAAMGPLTSGLKAVHATPQTKHMMIAFCLLFPCGVPH